MPSSLKITTTPSGIQLLLVAVLGMGCAAAALGRQATETGPPTLSPQAREWIDTEASSDFGRWLTDQLARAPEHPEWLDMFAAILKGSRLGPGEGWFATAVAQTRFAPEKVLARFDADRDGRLSADEFPSSRPDFQRLDRDSDGAITGPDLSWPEHALTPSAGALLFYQADQDGDGRVTPQEFDRIFRRADPQGYGFLSQDDLRALVRDIPPPTAGGEGATPPRRDGPSKSTLVQGLFRQEIGALAAGPDLDEVAPDFELRTVLGQDTVRLSELVGSRPIVLVFGNITCGPFRSQAGNVEKLYRMYRDRAHFVMIYVREAHPTDGWHMASNDQYGVSLAQPSSNEERRNIAQTCQRKLGFEMPFLVDTIDDSVGGRYSGMPSRLYVIDRQGKVSYKSGRGPFGFKPAEMEQALIWTLSTVDEQVPDAEPASRALERPAFVPFLDNPRAGDALSSE